MRLSVVLLVAAGWVASTPTRAEQRPFPPFPISLAVAAVDDRPVVDERWTRTRISRANAIFEDAGLQFIRGERRALPDRYARLDTRSDRHALREEAHPEMVNVFVVASLRDVDDPSRFRQGVHWRPPPRPGVHYVILSAIAGPDVLAHELGHFFGNHRHSDTPGNIMSYDRGDGEPFFDREQIRRIRSHARRFVRRGGIVPRRR